MRITTYLTCIALSVILVGMVSAAENIAPTRQDTAPAGTPASAPNSEPVESRILKGFNVAFPERGAPTANLLFELPEPQYVTLRIYDEAGQLVRGLLEGDRPAGFQTVAWNGRDRSGKDLDSGQYYALLGVAGKYVVRPVSIERGNSR